MFHWLYRRIAEGVITEAIDLIQDKEFTSTVLNPALDTITDRQFQRLTGRLGGISKGLAPQKLDIMGLISLWLQNRMLGQGQPGQTQPSNSSLDNKLYQVK